MDPTGMVGCKSTGGNDTVDVRMEQHVLSPRVQDREETNIGAKMLGVVCNLKKGLGDGLEEHVVEFGLVLENERV